MGWRKELPHDQEAITESARAERQRRVEDAIHSIDSDELVARARARYGLG